MNEPTLFDDSIETRFLAFHEANPKVWELLVRFTFELVDHGYKHAGISLIWERMRWEMSLQTTDPEGFKLNNDFRSRYARRLMKHYPEWEGFFRTRELRVA